MGTDHVSDRGRTGAAPTSGLRLRKPTVSGQPLQPPPPMDQTPFKTKESSAKPADDASTATDSSEEDALDQHVKNVLKKSKKEWLKRSLKGVWAFLKTPMGIITGIYGFMVVFWGAALVLFLLGECRLRWSIGDILSRLRRLDPDEQR